MPHHVYYQLAILGLVWLCVMLHYAWPSQSTVSPQPPAEPVSPQYKRKRSNDPKPFGLCTSPLRIIVSPRKQSKMPPYHPRVRGLFAMLPQQFY